MPSLAQYALAGSLLASAIGAAILCLLVVKYGFDPTAASDPAQPAARRAFVTRLGHVVAAVCFAFTGIFAVIATVSARGPAPDPSAGIAESRRDEMNALETRLRAAETRLAEAQSSVMELDAELARTTMRLALVEQMPAPPAAVEPPRATPPPARSAPPAADGQRKAARPSTAASAPRRETPSPAKSSSPAVKPPTITPPPAPSSPSSVEMSPSASPSVAAPPPVALPPAPAPSRPEPPTTTPSVAPTPVESAVAAAAPAVEAASTESAARDPVSSKAPRGARAVAPPRSEEMVAGRTARPMTGVGLHRTARVDGSAAVEERPRPSPAAEATPEPAPLDLRAKLQQDWEDIKKGTREAGQNLRNAVSETGRRLKGLKDWVTGR